VIAEADLIARLRAETPGVEEIIHLNNAGCALPPIPVVEAQIEYIRKETREGGYEAAERLGAAADAPYQALARLMHVAADEIGFCGNASDAWRRVLYALPLPAGARIAYDESMYGGNLLALLDGASRFGWELVPVAPDPATGTMDVAGADRLLRSGIHLLAITHMAAQSGSVSPLADLAPLAREHGALTLVDACQTVGQVPIDLAAAQVDCLVFTGRKYLRAPRGTGGFVVRRPLLDQIRPLGPDIRGGEVTPDGSWHLHPGARGLEQWERSWSLYVGLGAAFDYLLALDQGWVWDRISRVAAALVEALGDVPGVVVRRRAGERGGIVVFDLPDKDLAEARDWLRAHRANVMFAGDQNAPVEMFRVGDRGRLRASVHYFNTMDEVERFADLVGTCQTAL
jgi:cysteine desulfurase / selenocysteine lyase